MTIIGHFCEKLLEAGWLIAPVLVATFLNPFSEQVFEPDKAALFRALVVLMAAAWVVLILDRNRDAVARWRRPEHNPAGTALARAARSLREAPLSVLILIVLLVYCGSTAASILPGTSWWGSYQRTQGTFTFLTYLGAFSLVLGLLRRSDQLNRLLTVLLFTSFPVALYAILQHYGMSLLQFSEAQVDVRVISTLGNAIFLAAYLGMVIPLTLWRLLDSISRWSSSTVESKTGVLLYVGLFVLQLAAVGFTQSRGPILGLLAALFIFVLLVALLRRQRRWAVIGLSVAVVTVLFMAAINIPGPAAESLLSLPYVKRFSRLTGGTSLQSLQARPLAWDTVVKAISNEPIRMLLGYGPETMKPVLTTYMPAKLWVLQRGGLSGTFDRAHNAVFDALYARGILGVLAYLSLYASIFYHALRWLGLVGSGREKRVLALLLVGATGLGGIVPWLWRGDLVFIGVGMPVGMLTGMVLYLLGKLVRLPTGEPAADDRHRFLLAALLAAVVGHFVETQTGIGIVATRSYFWLYLSLMVLLGTHKVKEPEAGWQPAPRASGRGRRGRSRRSSRTRAVSSALLTPGLESVVVMGLVAAVLLGVLSYSFVHGFNVAGARGPAQGLIWATWLFAGLVVIVERDRFGAATPSAIEAGLTYAVTSLVWVLPFVLYHRVNAQALDRLDASYLAFLTWLLLTVGGIAVVLHLGKSSQGFAASPLQLMTYAAIAVAALIVVWRVDVTRVRADIYEKVGKTTMSSGLWDQAIPNLQRAVTLQPHQDQYYVFLGGAYVEQAQLASDVVEKDSWMAQALQTFQRGWDLAPRDSDHPRQLGLAYRVWAEWAEDPSVQQDRLRESVKYYLAAVGLNPENPDLRLALADAYFTLGRNAEAFDEYQHAVQIGSPRHLGRAHAGLGDVYLVRGQIDEAVEAFQRAMEAGRDVDEVLEARINAAKKHPQDVQVRESLALAYAAANRRDDALRELGLALEVASDDAEHAEIEQLMATIGE